MKILLPLDITQSTEALNNFISQVSTLIHLKEAELLLLYVNEVWPAYENMLGSSGEFADDWHNQVEKKAQTSLAEAEAMLSGKCAKVTHEIVSGPPAMMIETVARDEMCNMTVMMPGRHPAVEEFLLGSVSSKVVKHGPGTILIMRPLEKNIDQLRNVLIAIDGSPNAKEAMMKSVQMFGLAERDVNVLLLHSVDISDPIKYFSPVEFISRVEQNLLMEGETYLADAKRMLADAGVKRVDMALKEGRPAKEILAVAKSMPADLIIAGAEGRTAVQHFLLGSVSHTLAMKAPCAVAIIKRENKPA